MPPPTLASLVQHPGLGLAVRAGEDRLDREVRWVHASELPDPVPYMAGGELLLVTATNIDATDRDEMRRYVRRLAEAGVAGLGFGAGVNYAEIPAALLDAARQEGLPLIEVPRRTAFLAISKAVSTALAKEQYQALTSGFEAQRELTRAALSEGPAALLERLAGYVDGWAALYDPSGGVVASAPRWAGRRASRLAGDAARLTERNAPASAVAGDEDERTELQTLGTGRRVRGVLAVGTEGPLGTAERYAVNAAVALLTLTTERSGALRAAEQRLGAAVLRMLLAGQPDHARAVAGELYGGLLDAPFRLLVAESAEAQPGPEPPLGALAEDLEAAATRAGEAVLLVPDGTERLAVLAVDDGAVLAASKTYANRQADEAGVVVGLSAPTGPIAAASGYKQAEAALSVARRRGRALVEHEELATGSILPLLADDAVRAFADGMLRALHEHDAKGRGDLVASLRAWLGHHGQWDAAAADLGVHRHTLRYRMRRVEEILQRSLDDPDTRMELWLALKASAAPD